MAKVVIVGKPTSYTESNNAKTDADNNYRVPTLTGVDREEANVEVEKGEVVLSTDVSGNNKVTANVGGKKHHSGGTPEKLAPGSAVYSDNLKLEDPAMLSLFGVTNGKPKTFADLAKKFHTTPLVEKQKNPLNDKITKESLDRSLENANFKLSLAFTLQQFHHKKSGEQVEHSKHFEPLLERTGMSYEQLMDAPSEGNESSLSETPAQEGSMKDGGDIPMFDNGGINPYEKSNTVAGRTTPTGKGNYFSQRQESLDDYAAKWETILNKDIKNLSNQEAQREIYKWALEKNPEAIKNMWLTYGLTAKGMNDPAIKRLSKNGEFSKTGLSDKKVLENLQDAYVDGFFGVRQLDPFSKKIADDVEVKRIKVTPDGKIIDDPYEWDLAGMDDSVAPINMDYRWENKRALAQARKNRRNIPYLRPFTATPDVVYTDQAYYNPDQAIAAIQSESGQQQMQRSMFAGPQQQLANQQAGQAYSMIGQIVSQYADKNVNAYNTERNMNTQIAQRHADRLAHDAERHHDKITTLKQGYANAYMNADNAVAEQEIAMHTERANRKNLEASIGEQYIIDPDTGLHVFVKGKDFYPDNSAAMTVDDVYAEIIRKRPGIDQNIAAKLAMARMSGKYDIQESDFPAKAKQYTP